MRVAILFAAMATLVPAAADACSCALVSDSDQRQIALDLAERATVVRGVVMEPADNSSRLGELISVEDTLVGRPQYRIRIANRFMWGSCSYWPPQTGGPTIFILLPAGQDDSSTLPFRPMSTDEEIVIDQPAPRVFTLPDMCTMLNVDFRALIARAEELGRVPY